MLEDDTTKVSASDEDQGIDLGYYRRGPTSDCEGCAYERQCPFPALASRSKLLKELVPRGIRILCGFLDAACTGRGVSIRQKSNSVLGFVEAGSKFHPAQMGVGRGG